MKIAFLTDPLSTLNPEKDSSIELMREAASRGYRVFVADASTLAWDGQRVTGVFDEITLESADVSPWYRVLTRIVSGFEMFTAVLMRKDPPFDSEFLYTTHLLDHVGKIVPVINAPQALRDYNEKLALLSFSCFAPKTIVTSCAQDIHAFIDDVKDTVVKPLDSMGGRGIFRVRRQDPNRYAIVEAVTQYGTKRAMVQRFLPEITDGDKRIMLIDGEPLPFALARMAMPGETRANLAAGGTGIARPLQEKERIIAQAVGDVLKKRGLFLVGLDMIGTHLTEINVTSPTCFVEIRKQTGFSIAAAFWDRFDKVYGDFRTVACGKCSSA